MLPMAQQYEVQLNVYNNQVEFLMARKKTKKDDFIVFTFQINILLLHEWLFQR